MKLNKPQTRAEKDDKPGKQNQVLTPLDIKRKAKGKKGEQEKKERKTKIDKETHRQINEINRNFSVMPKALRTYSLHTCLQVSQKSFLTISGIMLKLFAENWPKR